MCVRRVCVCVCVCVYPTQFFLFTAKTKGL